LEDVKSWSSVFYNSISAVLTRVADFIPSLLQLLLILLVGWIISKLVSNLLVKFLTAVKFDDLADRVNANDLLEKANLKTTPSQLCGNLLYWFVWVLVLMSASDALGWDSISNILSDLINFLPRLVVALFFFIVGVYFATFIRDLIRGATSSIGIGAGKALSNMVYYFLFIIVGLTALEQGGFDTDIITSNLMLILGTILLSAAISYGLASKDVLSNMLAGFYCRKNFREGLLIEVNGVKGTVVARTSVSLTLRVNETEKVILPLKSLLNNQVKVFDKVATPPQETA